MCVCMCVRIHIVVTPQVVWYLKITQIIICVLMVSSKKYAQIFGTEIGSYFVYLIWKFSLLQIYLTDMLR